MNSITKSLMVFLSFSFITMPLQAETISESAFLLREAMMQSNADYNKHKKIENTEEFDRADEWGARDTTAINISNTPLNRQVQMSDSEFKELKREFEIDEHEVSSN